MTELEKWLYESERIFSGTSYNKVIEKAVHSFNTGNLTSCEDALCSLPTEEQMLRALVDRLKGKSVHKTLQELKAGKCKGSLSKAKALTSLMTHCIIEMENHKEYRMLLPRLLDRVNDVVYSVM